MDSVNFDSLSNAILDVLDENIIENYDMDVVLKSAKLVWDGTAVQVTSKDFLMIFDKISYELEDYVGLDGG